MMRCRPYLSSRQLQHHLGWCLLPHQRFQPEPCSGGPQPQQQGPAFPSSPMGGPQLGCGTSRAPWRAVLYTCPSLLPTERVSPPNFIAPSLGTTAHGWHPAILLPLLLTPPTVCSHSASLGHRTSAPPPSHRAPLYCSSVSHLEHHTSLSQDPLQDGPQ